MKYHQFHFADKETETQINCVTLHKAIHLDGFETTEYFLFFKNIPLDNSFKAYNYKGSV